MLNPEQTQCLHAMLLIAVLAGCTPLEWRKDGASPEDLSRDQAACSAQARNEAAHRLPSPIRAPHVISDPQGRAVVIRPASTDSERFALEQDLQRRCMQDLGYALQTPPKSP